MHRVKYFNTWFLSWMVFMTARIIKRALESLIDYRHFDHDLSRKLDCINFILDEEISD
jgi:hypothetical protein